MQFAASGSKGGKLPFAALCTKDRYAQLVTIAKLGLS